MVATRSDGGACANMSSPTQHKEDLQVAGRPHTEILTADAAFSGMAAPTADEAVEENRDRHWDPESLPRLPSGFDSLSGAACTCHR